jgi:hypothetical protein
MKQFLSVRVTLRRPLFRVGHWIQPGTTLAVPLPEAASLIERGIAVPEGAGVDFGAPPVRSWVSAWRTRS